MDWNAHGMESFKFLSRDDVAFFENTNLKLKVVDSRSNFLIYFLEALYSF